MTGFSQFDVAAKAVCTKHAEARFGSKHHSHTRPSNGRSNNPAGKADESASTHRCSLAQKPGKLDLSPKVAEKSPMKIPINFTSLFDFISLCVSVADSFSKTLVPIY
jgi:hypothetical protein